MSPKTKKKTHFDNKRRIIVRAPTVEKKKEWEDFARDIEGRSASNLAWHLMSEYMRSKKASIAKAAEGGSKKEPIAA